MKTPKLIGEIGINHIGDLQIAKRLIDAAFSCRWDYVKFQKRNPDICVPENQKYLIRDTPWGKIPYIQYRKKVEFGLEEYEYIDKYCKEKPIEWFASVWDLDSLKFMTQFNPPFIKIPSAKLTDYELLTLAAQTKIPIILSTGMSTLQEVDIAVQILEIYAKDFILMHTNSSYPSPYEEINLNIIDSLRERYHCKIGYSGHEYGLEPSVIASTKEVEFIERHITLDHDMWGTDQKASLEIEAMSLLRKRIITAIDSLGDFEKKVTKSEILIKEKLRG